MTIDSKKKCFSYVDTMCTNFLDHFFDAKNRITNHRKKARIEKVLFPLFSSLSFVRKTKPKPSLGPFRGEKKILVSFSHSLGLQPHVI